MANLALRSVLVLGILFWLLFAVLTAVLYFLHAPVWIAVIIAVVFMGLQYLISPTIIHWIHKINWQPPEHVDQGIATLIRQVCHEKALPEPRFGVIPDGNPNAFTFGHHPGSARIVITQGILDLLDEDERRAVVAHELGHIIDYTVISGHYGRYLFPYQFPEFQKLKGENEGVFGKGDDKVPQTDYRYISRYSKTNAQESFAEHFTAYILKKEEFRGLAEKEQADGHLELMAKYLFLEKLLEKTPVTTHRLSRKFLRNMNEPDEGR